MTEPVRGHVHVVGVAGVGMNPLAQMLRFLGHRVTGSDRFLDQGRRLPVLGQLEGLGIELGPQDGSLLSTSTEAVVISTAIEADNPERLRAVELGIPVLHRAEMLARAVNAGRCIAIAGTAGKTTTTGMAGWLLTELGFDPSVVNGAGLVNWKDIASPGNVRDGGDLWVFEADESDRSFLHFTPEWAVITNVAADHFDLPETIELFREFASGVRRGLILSPATRTLLEPLPAHLEIIHPVEAPVELSLLGAHNQENARHAAALVTALGADPIHARQHLPRFRGIERRLEETTPPGSAIRVFDDYAHNPGKIAAAWRTVSQAVPGRVFGVWRPHGFGPLRQNLEAFRDTFHRACADGDQLLLLPVFYAGGTANPSVDASHLAEQLEACRLCHDYGAVQSILVDELRKGDAVLFMGARDPDLPVRARLTANTLTLPEIHGVILDLDGLLLDTETLSHEAWRCAGREGGIEVPMQMCTEMTGKRLTDMMPLMNKWLPAHLDKEAFLELANVHYNRLLIDEPPAIKPGVPELLTHIESAGLPCIVASSSLRMKIEKKLKGAGLIERLPHHVSGHEVPHGKPAPDIFYEAARQIGVDPAHCLVFEDSPTGVQAAHAAGCITIMVPDCIPYSPEVPARVVLRDLSEAIGLLDRS